MGNNGDKTFYSDYIEYLLDNHFNYTAVVQGSKEYRVRIGKSWWVLGVCETLMPYITGREFTMENVAFTGEDFMRIAMNSEKHDAIAFDDAGVDYSCQTWWNQTSLMISRALETYGYKELMCYLTLPHHTILNKIGRTMAYQLIIVRKRGVAEVYNIEVGEFDGVMRTPYQGVVKVPKPSKKLTNLYEKMKDEAHTKLYNDDLIKIKSQRSREERSRPRAIGEMAIEVLQNREKFEINGKISRGLIRDHFKIGQGRAGDVMELCNIK